ncbi:MAG: TetR/AcrR family transcriptional regulator [Thermodesulfobacteriota bacterium]|nr:TetR/AcrR family transcriptional regulator [Thermodesulfobacteriota bacterium]
MSQIMLSRKQLKQKEKEDRTLEIYDKALKLFLKEGYDNTPMSRIAEVLGMSKAGLYYYCTSKENLLFLIHKDYLERNFIPLIDEAEKIDDPKERLCSYLRNYAKLFTNNPAPRVLVHEVHRLDKKHQDYIKAIWKRTFRLIRKAINELQKKGDARMFRDSFVSFMAIGMCCWTYYWYDYGRPSTGDELADTLVKLFFKGIEKGNYVK